jgi:hypothetical protein
MSLHSLFLALGASPLGHFMQALQWAFAIVEMLHLLALALLGGCVLVIDLRLLGLIFRGESAPTLARDLTRLLTGSFIVMVLSGIALLSEEAGKCYYNPAFRWKMALLCAAILFTYTLHHRALARTGSGTPPPWCRAAAILSLALWLGVGIAGRAIGLL